MCKLLEYAQMSDCPLDSFTPNPSRFIIGCTRALVNRVQYLWYNTGFMLNVLAQSGCLLSNAVTTQSIDLVFHGQVFCLLVLISCHVMEKETHMQYNKPSL